MAKRNSPERKAELAARREKQRNAVPTRPYKTRGKYIPAGVNKNIRPENR